MKKKLLLVSIALLVVIVGLVLLRPHPHTDSEQPLPSSPTPSTQGRPKSFPYQVIELRAKVQHPAPTQQDAIEARVRTQDAIKLFGKDNAHAETLLKEASDFDPTNLETLIARANLALDLGKYDEADDRAIDCLSLDRKRIECHTVLVTSFLRQNDYDGSYSYLLDCLADDAENGACLWGITEYQLYRNQPQEAKRTLDHLLKDASDSSLAMIAQGRYQERTGNKADAKASYEKACKQGQKIACSRIETLH